MITVIVIALALCAVVLFYTAVRSRRKQAAQSFRPVDLNAFRTLMDRDDELFMKEKLPHSKFTRLKRQRIRVTVRYATATQVMELAAQIRLQCLVALAKLSLEYAMPSLQLTPALLVPKYQSLRENVRRLGDLQTQTPIPLASAI